MSFKATEWAYGLRELSGPEKAVLCNLAWHHNAKTGLCCPGNQLIADETGLGLSTVKKALRSLKEKGLVSPYPWKGRSAYMLAIVEPEKATRELAHIEQENNRKERKGSDWKGRERPAPLSDGRARAEKRIAEFKAVLAPVEDRGTEEDRAAVVARALALFRSPADHPGQSPAFHRLPEREGHRWRGAGESDRSPGRSVPPSRRL